MKVSERPFKHINYLIITLKPACITGPENEMQKQIVEAFMHAWTGYKQYAWGHDELKPLTKGWRDWFGVGLTIVDSLDTMWMMGLKDGTVKAL